MVDLYGIQKVSEITGIPAVTLRAWERRYNVIRPARSEGGTRLYTEENVEDILWVKEQKEKNKISVKEAMGLLDALKKETSVTQPLTFNSLDDFISPLYEHLIHFRTEEANRILDQTLAIYDYELVFHHIVKPLLYRTGDDWSAGHLTVIQEHFISNLLVRRLEMLFQNLIIDPGLPKAAALCPPNEEHSIGLLLFSLFLKKRGHDVLFLGENTPLNALESFIITNNVKMLTLSVTLEAHAEELFIRLSELKKRLPFLRLVLGGNGIKNPPSELQSDFLEGGLNKWLLWYRTLDA